jgi:hypothetical protein
MYLYQKVKRALPGNLQNCRKVSFYLSTSLPSSLNSLSLSFSLNCTELLCPVPNNFDSSIIWRCSLQWENRILIGSQYDRVLWISASTIPNSCLRKFANFLLHHAMKTYGGSGVIPPPFLTSALAGGEWSALRPWGFIRHPEKEPQGPLDWRLGGPQSQYGRCGKEKNLALTGSNPGCPARRCRGWAIPTTCYYRV